jgi:hypothetical protein
MTAAAQDPEAVVVAAAAVAAEREPAREAGDCSPNSVTNRHLRIP